MHLFGSLASVIFEVKTAHMALHPTLSHSREMGGVGGRKSGRQGEREAGREGGRERETGRQSDRDGMMKERRMRSLVVVRLRRRWRWSSNLTGCVRSPTQCQSLFITTNAHIRRQECDWDL